MSNREVDYTHYYQRWHDDSDTHFESVAAAEGAWLAPFLPPDSQLPILDVGCGMGFAVAGMQHAGHPNAEGIDADEGQVLKAQRRGLAVTHVRAAHTASWMAERRGRYALVTAIDVLEHVPPQEHIEFLAGVLGLLQQGGTFVCRVPNANSAVSGRYRYGDWTHHTSFTEDSLDFVLYNAGFRKIQITDAAPYRLQLQHFRHPALLLLGFFRVFRRLEFVAEFGRDQGRKIPLSPNIVAVAAKNLAVV